MTVGPPPIIPYIPHEAQGSHTQTKTKPNTLTIVIKLGTSSIVSPSYPFLPRINLLSSIVDTVVRLRGLGHGVVLCSSGAIGMGLKRMGLKERGKGLSHKQALAAVGQGRLIALWDNLFSQLDQPIAQILLTRMDISDRTRYLNAQNTFSELVQMGVVPIVNENDTVSVSEIQFGDNDTLSAISSAIVRADYLFLLTDVECLYTDNPRNNPDAKPVRVVRDIAQIRQQVSTTTLGSALGTGGMSTKIIAAELATAAGVTTVVMHAEKISDVFRIIESGVGPSRESGEDLYSDDGPLCTRFLRTQDPMRDRKWWIAHGLHAAGTVVIDEGAMRAITRKKSGGRLLPAGVVRVEGVFASHQAVRLVVRKRRSHPHHSSDRHSADSDGSPSSPSSRRFDRPMAATTPFSPPSHSRPSPLLVQAAGSSSSSPDIVPEPDTPLIQPALSLSSSIASLDPLSRSVPQSPAILGLTERLAAATFNSSSLSQELRIAETTEVLSDGEDMDINEWEEIEIGKGLALYNSVEIDRIKGMKSSNIEIVLGYSESEHVVDSITFFH